ncbi:transposase [Streptomyces carpinensis]|uniref:Transposase n=1 Tax=Streptomyces carpinensis TaxID=66369 RepID=A0ABV1W758_9ACTN
MAGPGHYRSPTGSSSWCWPTGRTSPCSNSAPCKSSAGPVTGASLRPAKRGPATAMTLSFFRETLARTLPNHPRLSGDGGYRGSTRIRTPHRGPDGRIIKDRNYRRFRKRRAVAEHTIARLKDHQVLRQCRRHGNAINHAVAGVAALHNLKLDIR